MRQLVHTTFLQAYSLFPPLVHDCKEHLNYIEHLHLRYVPLLQTIWLHVCKPLAIDHVGVCFDQILKEALQREREGVLI
ncbi:hypothetical protein D3C79_869730 [compost metagenome]